MTNPLPKRAKTALIITWGGLWAERLTLAFWPLLAVLLAALGVLLLSDVSIWPLELVWFAALAFGLSLLLALFFGLRRFAWPRRAQALDRVDAQYPGRPLGALEDSQATGLNDTGAQDLWAAHIDRMKEKAAATKAVSPNLQVSRYDPFAMRYVAVLLAAVGLIFGGWSSLRDVSLNGNDVAAAGPSWEGWIQPPAYTRRPSIYLPDVVGQAVKVPQDSDVILRLYGDVGSLTVDETVSARLENLTAASDPEQSFKVLQSGRLAISGRAEWSILMEEDQPPAIEIVSTFEEAPSQFTHTYNATDDYGVVAARARISLNLDEVDRRHGLRIDPMPRAPLELTLPITIAGDRRDFQEKVSEDLSQHPWANLQVRIVFEVEDELGQIGQADVIDMPLPSRGFFDPMAKALIEQRRDMLWSGHNKTRISQILRAVSLDEGSVFRIEENATTLEGIIADLEALPNLGMDPDEMDAFAQRLWDLALAIEDGDLASAAEALARAQEKLAEAIRNGASQEDIQRLMNELRQAQRDYMEEFAERNPPQPGEQQQSSEGQDDRDMVTQDQLSEMMDRLQQLMEEGRMAEAQELLDEINRLMENLEMQQAQQGQQGQQQQGQQQMQDLAETLRQQQELSDDSFREFQEQFDQQGQQQQGQQQGQQGQQGEQPGQQGQGQQPGGEQQGGQQQGQGQGQGSLSDQLAQRQQGLRQELNRQRGNLPGAGTEPGQEARRNLDRAGEAMDRAEENLRNGQLGDAIQDQAEAIDALRDGLQNMGEALAQENGGQQGQQDGEQTGQNGPVPDENLDPLGRSNGSTGQLGTDENLLPEEELRRRSQDLIDEIRRRSGALDRSEDERDYLKRLLDQF